MTLGKGGDKARVVVVVGWEGVRKEKKRIEEGKKIIELRNSPRQQKKNKKKKKKEQAAVSSSTQARQGIMEMKLKRKKPGKTHETSSET